MKLKSILKEILLRELSAEDIGKDRLESLLLDYIKRNYSDLGEDYVEERTRVVKGPTEYSLVAYIPTKILDEEDWDNFFKKYGYYVGHVFDDDDKDFPDDWGAWNTKLRLYSIETKKVEDLTDKLYHITPKNKLLKIKRSGLVPKKGEKTFSIGDNRIYFVKDTSLGQIDQLKDKLKNYVKENPPFGDEMAVLEIDANRLNNNNFYHDPEMDSEWSIFTKSNVPSNAITNWSDFKEELKILRNQ